MAEVECRSSSVKEVMQGYKDPCLSLSAMASLSHPPSLLLAYFVQLTSSRETL
jgi:hypothetical protein